MYEAKCSAQTCRPPQHPMEDGGEAAADVPSFRSQPSRSGLKKVWVRSLPSSSGILKGSLRMLS